MHRLGGGTGAPILDIMGTEHLPRRKQKRCDVPWRVELRIVESLKRGMAVEGQKVDTVLGSLHRGPHRDLESAKREILEAIHRVETSVDLLAQEVARRGGKAEEDNQRGSI